MSQEPIGGPIVSHESQTKPQGPREGQEIVLGVEQSHKDHVEGQGLVMRVKQGNKNQGEGQEFNKRVEQSQEDHRKLQEFDQGYVDDLKKTNNSNLYTNILQQSKE